MRSPAPGVATVTIAKRTGRPTKRLWQGRLGPGAVKVNVDPKRLRLGDGVYVVVARFAPDDNSGETEQRRRVIFDRTLGVDRAALGERRRAPGAGPAGGRLPPAAPCPRHRGGAVGLGGHARDARPQPPHAAGAHDDRVDRRRGRSIVSGAVQVTVEARSRFGTRAWSAASP